MAGTVTLSPEAPADETVRFSFGNVEFSLDPGKPYETDDPDVLRGAQAHPWCEVTLDPVPVEEADVPDPNDPHNNPEVDHLSEWATPEAVAAAAANEAAIKAANGVEDTEPADVTPTDDTVSATPADAPTSTLAESTSTTEPEGASS
jgi:hypothetical protein